LLQVAPLGASVQAPEPLHVAAPAHSLLGSVPFVMGAHVPLAAPVFAPLHDWQVPEHVVPQQTPSCAGQTPL
jgi:hypothetical protein